MKKLFIIMMISLPILAQNEEPTFEDEIIFHLINYPSQQVTISAERVDNYPMWFPSHYTAFGNFVNDDTFDLVSAQNRQLSSEFGYGTTIFFDTEGDQNSDRTLGLSMYKIEVNNTNKYDHSLLIPLYAV